MKRTRKRNIAKAQKMIKVNHQRQWKQFYKRFEKTSGQLRYAIGESAITLTQYAYKLNEDIKKMFMVPPEMLGRCEEVLSNQRRDVITIAFLERLREALTGRKND